MPPNGSPISTNQEWFIKKVEGRSKTYRIKNIKSPTMFLDAKDDGSADSRVKLYERVGNDESQMWIFEKA
ncbi:MAG: RICIN domain-containing protein [Terrimonas sp.]|nr:RICIN domain-containing protein [Terrimonas sp.]OJY88687.1 MAG: hypothetical protein BGP13_17435 [Sphingobacteriales bacterium 40-81]